MSAIGKLKTILPISSRSFHAAEKHFVEQTDSIRADLIETKLKQNELLARIKHIDSNVDVINEKCADVSNALAAEAERNKLRMEALMKKTYPEDSPAAIRRRIFSLMPEAEGDARIMQKANAKLMFELDSICQKAGLPYWTAYGSLVGTLSRNGFIPWDDDIDICMMREDTEKLQSLCDADPNYQLTLVYDGYVFCRQLRFSSRNENIPCFIDVSIWDWAASSSKENDELYRNLRLELMATFGEKMESLPYWKERGLLYSAESGEIAQGIPISRNDQNDSLAHPEIEAIEGLFQEYRNMAYEKGILCDKANATAVAYGIDNIYDAPWRRTLWPLSMMLPAKPHQFENGSINIPNDAIAVADECYPGWPYLPDDILGHNHFTENAFSDPAVRDALKAFISD
ncbi:MAG: LicD family protein [Eggerthellaceae bacterium]